MQVYALNEYLACILRGAKLPPEHILRLALNVMIFIYK